MGRGSPDRRYFSGLLFQIANTVSHQGLSQDIEKTIDTSTFEVAGDATSQLLLYGSGRREAQGLN